MGRNVLVSEGGSSSRIAGVDKVKTTLQAGGSSLWVPASERRVMTKYIHENGTYYASDDDLYGYSKVTVNVSGGAPGMTVPTTTVPLTPTDPTKPVDPDNPSTPECTVEVPNEAIDAGDYTLPEGVTESEDTASCIVTEPGTHPGASVTGVNNNGIQTSEGYVPPDGNKYVVKVDDDGGVSAKAIPTAIVITHLPDKLHYTDGQAIDFTGLEVSAYLRYEETHGSGGSISVDAEGFKDERYIDGKIPTGELMFPVTHASFDGANGYATHSSTGDIKIPFSGSGFSISYISSPGYSIGAYLNGTRVTESYGVGGLAIPVSVHHGGGINRFHEYYRATCVIASLHTNIVSIVETDPHPFDETPTPEDITREVTQDEMTPFTFMGKTVQYEVVSIDRNHLDPPQTYSPEEGDKVVGGGVPHDLAAWVAMYGMRIVTNTIPVQWRNPYDGEVLETSFTIQVATSVV